jgi:hypothetical protein
MPSSDGGSNSGIVVDFSSGIKVTAFWLLFALLYFIPLLKTPTSADESVIKKRQTPGAWRRVK